MRPGAPLIARTATPPDPAPGRSQPQRCHYASKSVKFYGVVSSQTETALELFLEREHAEEFVAEVAEDEPETAALLRVEAVELA
jgi:hypothetical protein